MIKNLPTSWGPPQIRSKTQVDSMYTIEGYAKIIPKLGFTLNSKKMLIPPLIMQPILFVFI
jgi:hypothetical protein